MSIRIELLVAPKTRWPRRTDRCGADECDETPDIRAIFDGTSEIQQLVIACAPDEQGM